MIVFIPIGSFDELNQQVLSGLVDHEVRINYVKGVSIENEKLPRVRESFDSIKNQKNNILDLGSRCGEEYFIMHDSDIRHLGDGIELLAKEAKENPDFSAIGLWPHINKDLKVGVHVSSACMIIKAEDVENFKVEYKKGCFCSAFGSALRKQGKKIKYLNKQNLIRELKKDEE